MVFKKIATFITVLVFSMTGSPSITLADVGDEDAGAFDDDTNTVQESEEVSGDTAAVTDAEDGAGEKAGPGAGAWVAITGAVLALFSGGTSEYTTPAGLSLIHI